MRLHILNSNSQGNAYILYNQDEALLIEAGVNFDRVKQVLNFQLSKVAGCIISHEHKDHCKYVNDVLKASIDVWATAGTHQAMGTADHHRARITFSGDQFSAGKFKIKPFDVKHDAAEPAGFLINHPECGTVLFLTDSYYSEYKFPGLNNVIIEANNGSIKLNSGTIADLGISSKEDKEQFLHLVQDDEDNYYAYVDDVAEGGLKIRLDKKASQTNFITQCKSLVDEMAKNLDWPLAPDKKKSIRMDVKTEADDFNGIKVWQLH